MYACKMRSHRSSSVGANLDLQGLGSHAIIVTLEGFNRQQHTYSNSLGHHYAQELRP